MSTHNIGFHEEISKIIFQLSSNTHFISSSAGKGKQFSCAPDREFRIFTSFNKAYLVMHRSFVSPAPLGPEILGT